MGYVKSVSLVFSAGCMGGLTNSLAVWFFGKIGLTGALGVSIAPALSPLWLYPRVVWGGIWGFLFLIPFLKGKLYLKGFIYSIGPTLVQLFIIFPVRANKGIMGLELGAMTPLFVVIFNAIWGITASFWLLLSDEL